MSTKDRVEDLKERLKYCKISQDTVEATIKLQRFQLKKAEAMLKYERKMLAAGIRTRTSLKAERRRLEGKIRSLPGQVRRMVKDKPRTAFESLERGLSTGNQRG
jgi:hypothetical protein